MADQDSRVEHDSFGELRQLSDVEIDGLLDVREPTKGGIKTEGGRGG